MEAHALATGMPEKTAAEMHQVFATAVDLHRSGHFQQAEQLYRTLLKVQPQHTDALHMLGVLANDHGQHDQAAAFISRAIALDDRHAAFYYNLGVALQKSERLTDAVNAYRTATERDPGLRAAWENLGVAYQELERFEEAIHAYLKACELDPDAVLANANLGTLLLEHGDAIGARRHIEHALGANPINYRLLNKLASIDLWQGHYARGWRHHESRFCSEAVCEVSPLANAPWPKWTGTPMPEGTLLVTAEQGIGEDLLFASCMDELSELVGHVIIATDARLIPIYRRSMRHATVVGITEPLQHLAIDRRISAGSLPALLRPSTEFFPRQRQYLWCDPARRSHWRDWLAAAGNMLNVGISWRGGRTARAQRARSIPLSMWRTLTCVPGARFYSVQYGEHGDEIEHHNAESTRVHVVDGLNCRDDLDDLSAFVSALDLVITIDNATAHLAGALGVDTWLLRPRYPEWRWREDDFGNPWMPSVSVLSPDEPGQWEPVMTDCAGRLRDVVNGPLRQEPAPLPRRDARAAPALSPRIGTAALLNDTTHWYHFGCTATSLAIHDRLREHGFAVSSIPTHLIDRIATLPDSLDAFDSESLFNRFRTAHPELIRALEDVDVVYVNGEGTLHRLHAQPLALLYLMHIANTRLDKPVRVINHSCYPEGDLDAPAGVATRIYQHVYAQLDQIAVREPLSAALLRDLGLAVTDSFDCLPLYVDNLLDRQCDSNDPYVVIAGGVAWRPDTLPAIVEAVQHLRRADLAVHVLTGANAFPAADESRFVSALSQACRDDIRLTIATSEAEWLNEIGNARLVLSSRFHHSIAAAFLGTPFLVSGSNTPKIAGLLDRLSMDAQLSLPEPGDAAALQRFSRTICERIDQALNAPHTHRLAPDVRQRLISLSLANFPAN